MDDPRLLGAYLLFYWPVSYAQARSVLGELERRPREVLDLGSGRARWRSQRWTPVQRR
jgi:hypothetical protein